MAGGFREVNHLGLHKLQITIGSHKQNVVTYAEDPNSQQTAGMDT